MGNFIFENIQIHQIKIQSVWMKSFSMRKIREFFMKNFSLCNLLLFSPPRYIPLFEISASENEVLSIPSNAAEPDKSSNKRHDLMHNSICFIPFHLEKDLFHYFSTLTEDWIKYKKVDDVITTSIGKKDYWKFNFINWPWDYQYRRFFFFSIWQNYISMCYFFLIFFLRNCIKIWHVNFLNYVSFTH